VHRQVYQNARRNGDYLILPKDVALEMAKEIQRQVTRIQPDRSNILSVKAYIDRCAHDGEISKKVKVFVEQKPKVEWPPDALGDGGYNIVLKRFPGRYLYEHTYKYVRKEINPDVPAYFYPEYYYHSVEPNGLLP